MTFYTYLWLREDGSPYYVGKGKGDRAFEDHGWGRPPKDSSRIILQYWLDESTALAFEIYQIDFWGRKDLGIGILRNMTDGGENPPKSRKGKRQPATSEATKLKLSRILTGMKKPPRTLDHRRKLSLANQNKPSYERTNETLGLQSEAQKGKPRPYCVGHRNYCTPEGVERMRASKIGSKASPETRATMAKSAVTGWAKRRGELQLSL